MTFDQYQIAINKKITTLDDVLLLIPKTVEDVPRYVKWSMESTDKSIKTFLSIPAQQRTFENTVNVYDTLGRNLGVIESNIHILEMTHPDKAMRDACHQALLDMQAYSVDALHKKEIYQAFKDYDQGNRTKEVLSAEGDYSLKEAMRAFARGGFDLPDEQFEKVKTLEKQIAEFCLTFESNIAQAHETVAVDPAVLTGLKADFVQSLKKDSAGKVILGCDYPTYFEVIEHCSNEQVRKDLFLLFNNRAYPKNQAVLAGIIAVRDELAQILGFDSYAALDLDGEMVETVERAEQFLWDLTKKLQKKAEQELKTFAADLPVGVTLDNQGRFDPWSVSFAKNYYKEKYLKVDEHAVAEYFPVDKALAGVFDVYQKFLGLTFTHTKPTWAWHPDVQVLEIYETKTHKLRGYLFLDLYPRENKYSHACLAPMVPTVCSCVDGTISPAVATMIANFPRARGGNPALLKFDDLKTFFHEFGHAMHNVLGATELAGNAGCTTKTDFVETPSQMFEEWLYNKDVLRMVSSHYKTGAPLPDELVDRLVALKTYDTGLFVLRQSALALAIMACFKQGKIKNTGIIFREIFEKVTPLIRIEPAAHLEFSIGHFAGYGAKYYSYMWSLVFAIDVYYQVRKEGLLNPQAGSRLVDQILGKGGSVDPNILLRTYLGREPNCDAFLDNLGA